MTRRFGSIVIRVPGAIAQIETEQNLPLELNRCHLTNVTHEANVGVPAERRKLEPVMRSEEARSFCPGESSEGGFEFAPGERIQADQGSPAYCAG